MSGSEIFLVFCEPFINEPDEDDQEVFTRVIDFISSRTRSWEIVLFRCKNDSDAFPLKYIENNRNHLERIKDLNNKSEPFYHGVRDLYSPDEKNPLTLHSWLKKFHFADSRLHQQIL